MEIELTPEQDSFVHLGIQEGRFRDEKEAVRQALALWERRERARLELIMSIDMAETSLDAGEGAVYTEDTLHELTADVRRRGMEGLATK
jgi:putative addiction module CopG family antidote